MQSARTRRKEKVFFGNQQQLAQQQPHPSKGKKGKAKGKPANGLVVQSLDQAWPVEEQVVQGEPVSATIFKLGESEDPPWTVVRRKRRDGGNDPETSQTSTVGKRTRRSSLLNDRNLSILEPGNVLISLKTMVQLRVAVLRNW